VFPQDGYNEKLARYDEMEESEDSFEEELISKLLYYVSFWYVGKVNSEEDFKRLLMETEGTSEEEAEEPKKEEPKKEEPKKEEPKKEEPKKEEPKKEEPKKEEPPKEVKPKVKQTPNPDEEKSG
jgi:outer membrane biosynthesis protein TonB